MFGFFRKKQEQRQATEAKDGNALEAALMLHLATDSDQSLARFLAAFGNSQLWILNQTAERLGDPAITEGPDGKPYVAVFTSHQRATTAVAENRLPNRPSDLSALELVFALSPSVGIVLNFNDPHLCWTFSPERVSDLRMLFERSHKYEAGGIYSIWSQGAFRAAKLLVSDELGVHLRIYANTFSERPAEIDLASLTLKASGDGAAQGLGHIPLSKASFLAMGPKLMTIAPVTDDDLDGYRIWAEAKGGYFGAS